MLLLLLLLLLLAAPDGASMVRPSSSDVSKPLGTRKRKSSLPLTSDRLSGVTKSSDTSIVAAVVSARRRSAAICFIWPTDNVMLLLQAPGVVPRPPPGRRSEQAGVEGSGPHAPTKGGRSQHICHGRLIMAASSAGGVIPRARYAHALAGGGWIRAPQCAFDSDPTRPNRCPRDPRSWCPRPRPRLRPRSLRSTPAAMPRARRAAASRSRLCCCCSKRHRCRRRAPLVISSTPCR